MTKGILPLDSTLFNLDDKHLKFFRSLTGFTDDEVVKKHIMAIQAMAYELFPYPCIRHFSFAKLPITRIPYYERALMLCRKSQEAIFLDLGCCFGSDLRKVVLDGWPASKAIGSDLCPQFWQWGHELYRTSPSTFPAGFVPGDAFNPQILSLNDPFYLPPPTTPKPTNLSSLTSLNPLKGHVSAIHTSLLFHLFDEEKQLDLARRLASLLSPEEGSMIFGGHYARPKQGVRTEILADGILHTQFWHSPRTWKQVWEEQVFRKGSVRVEVDWTLSTEYVNMDGPKDAALYYMTWCITRL